MSDKILTRIQRLLALAGNNPSQSEAEAAMLQARKLMAEHNLSDADITADEERKIDKLIESILTESKRYERERSYILSIIASNHRCAVLLQKTYDAQTYKVVGFERDVAIVGELFRWAYDKADLLSRIFIKRRKLAGLGSGSMRTARQSFMLGFAQGLKDAYTAQTKANPQWALVLATPREVAVRVDEETNGKKRRKNAPLGKVNHEAVKAGIEAGRKHVHDSSHSEKPTLAPKLKALPP